MKRSIQGINKKLGINLSDQRHPKYIAMRGCCMKKKGGDS
jgi:hypothetical protein